MITVCFIRAADGSPAPSGDSGETVRRTLEPGRPEGRGVVAGRLRSGLTVLSVPAVGIEMVAAVVGAGALSPEPPRVGCIEMVAAVVGAGALSPEPPRVGCIEMVAAVVGAGALS